MKIRKRPVQVDGWLISDLLDIAKMGAASLPPEVREAYQAGTLEFEADRIVIATLEGVMTGWVGWWLIRGIEGEWYPCDHDIFDRTYDIVEPLEGHPVDFPIVDPYAHAPEM